MIQDYVSFYSTLITYNYNSLKEAAIYRTLSKHLGKIPNTKVLKENGAFVISRQYQDEYEEFRWAGKGLFQIRIKMEDYKMNIEVKDLV